MEGASDKFYYVYSSAINERVAVKIGTLEGKRKRISYEEILERPTLKFTGVYQKDVADLMVLCKVVTKTEELSLPTTTSYKAFTNRWNWNEWIPLPIHYCDLPRDAILVFTIYDSIPEYGEKLVIGSTAIPLFDQHGIFRQGIYDLKIEPDIEADDLDKLIIDDFDSSDANKDPANHMFRLSQLTKKHRNGLITKIDWLDRLTFREIEVINEREKRKSNHMYLMVEFPNIFVDNILHSVVYYEEDGDEVYQYRKHADIVTIPDPEILQDNLVEKKHHILSRSLRSGISEKDLKPNSEVRDRLKKIVDYPPTNLLNNEEQDLIWKFRFYLSSQKKALTKFLKCVNWKLPAESKQAQFLMSKWEPMDVEDSLELLGPNFTHPCVRKYAVSRLRQAPDDDLLLYLLQLVQALKYENFECDESAGKKEMLDDILRKFERVMKVADDFNSSKSSVDSVEVISGSDLYAEEAVEAADIIDADGTSIMTKRLADGSQSCIQKSQDSLVYDECDDLASFLIDRACKNQTLASYFYWYLWTECENQETNEQDKNKYMYTKVLKIFLDTITRNAEYRNDFNFLIKQRHFTNNLIELLKKVNRESSGRKRKIDKLRQLLAEAPTSLSDIRKFNFCKFPEPIRFPLDPQIRLHETVAEKATFFKSALMPCRLTFMVSNVDDVSLQLYEYVAIFKYGDDLRQDQLILQMITLIDKLWRRENLDLKLTPYKVIATSTRHGFLQFIESETVSEALNEDGSIQNFFRKHSPSPNSPYGISTDVMDTYIRSCAGYCIITYILGVGDRHLENLLLMKDGHLFHIDFGYILGRDPKPFPPPMKLSKEMVEAMGGLNSELYNEFRKLCFTAFLRLRGHANLLLNLFSLMIDASVPDIALEPDKAVKKIQDKLRLDLDDEAAIVYLKELLDESVTAVMSALVDHIHKFAQYWRR